MKYIVIRDMSAGNETIGETWQETRIFDESATLKEVMKWALRGDCLEVDEKCYSRKRITITKPDTNNY